MTSEQRVILELADVLALRLECLKCGAAVVLKPADWSTSPVECPGCRNTWELPRVSESGYTPINYLGMGLRRLLEQAASQPKPTTMREVAPHTPLPYRVKIEIKDPLAGKQ